MSEISADRGDQAKNEEIEALRAVAIILVIFQHSFNYLTFWIPGWAQVIGAHFNLGQAGVDLFLAVSGYVIAKSIMPRFNAAGSSLDAWREMLAFWVKRIFRLWPTVFFWVLADILLAAFFNRSGAFGALRETIVAGISVLAQVANFHLALCVEPSACFDKPVFTLGPLWSLSLEEQFYFLFPILLYALVVNRRMNYLLPILTIVAVAQLFLARPDGNLLLYIRTDALCGGVIIYLVSGWDGTKLLREPLSSINPFVKALTIALLFLILTAITGRAVRFNAGISAIVAVAIVMIAHFEAGWFALRRGSLFQGIVMWIAERSFSIYVIHCICIAATREIWWRLSDGVPPTATSTFKFYLTWTLLLIAAVELNWRFLESPLRQRGRQVAARWFSKQQETMRTPGTGPGA